MKQDIISYIILSMLLFMELGSLSPRNELLQMREQLSCEVGVKAESSSDVSSEKKVSERQIGECMRRLGVQEANKGQLAKEQEHKEEVEELKRQLAETKGQVGENTKKTEENEEHIAENKKEIAVMKIQLSEIQSWSKRIDACFWAIRERFDVFLASVQSN